MLLRALRPDGLDERIRIKESIARRVRQIFRPNKLVEEIQTYAEWIEQFDELNSNDLELIATHIEQRRPPELLVIWFLMGAGTPAIHDAVQSLAAQLCGNWRAILVTDEPQSSSLLPYSDTEGHLPVVIVRSKSDIAPLAQAGTPCLLINGAGRLAKHATYMFGVELDDARSSIYCDEDIIDDSKRIAPRFAPKFSPEFPAVKSVMLVLLTNSILAHLSDLASPEINLTKVALDGYFGAGIESRHIPFILFSATAKLDTPIEEEQSFIAFAPERLVARPKVTIVIPTRDRLDFLEPCITSILEKTDYPRTSFEIVVVDNGSTDPDVLKFLSQRQECGDIRVIRDAREFNYSRLNNHAAIQTEGDLLAFVNNDVVVVDPLWLQRLSLYAMQPGVGAVGSKLLYPDLTVQHGGIVLGIQGVVAHAHLHLAADAPGYMGLNNATRAISAVTGACLVIKRSTFNAVGGFDENLSVAFSDVLLCIAAGELGLRNIYVGQSATIHFESKTRGYDDTDAKRQLFQQEARYARRKARLLFKEDPYYNENLSLEKTYELGFPPRAEKPWHRFRRQTTRRLRIFMLSSTHQVGHGVAVVVDIQARYLAALGHTIYIGGPSQANEFPYPNCIRVPLNTPKDAAIFANKNGIDCIVMHTPPFYSTTRWLGASVKTLAYDYGEPNPDFFPDAAARRIQIQEKSFCIEMADACYAISRAVKDEAQREDMGIIPLGNSHLAQWSDAMLDRRASRRSALGFDGQIVILNVCRFHASERLYKGVDQYCELLSTLKRMTQEHKRDIVFVLAGKGTDADVRKMTDAGLRVFANISDEELVDLYCCADIYANFSRWEGYNLGIGQALAMGLPVIASDIPAHRAFDVFVSNRTEVAAQELLRLTDAPASRVARVTDWIEPLEILSEVIDELNFPGRTV
ncbi:glycosyltransferase [Variovorax sp. J2P1-59]|uniref:glycosyltransferase n=1 Tax=Variovorax flavidus TaxID=3053501 RepID=UPI00257705A1|nr:glycosyltransferase [Variovorax sp. J2P1-59]MDM0077385.1 glycosyltransferase [Variovorax sp. J2P1-59]